MHSNIMRFATAIPTGGAVTFALLFVMQALISMQSGNVIERTLRLPVDWHHVDLPEELFPEEFMEPDLPPIEQPPTRAAPLDPVDPGPGLYVPYTSPPPGGPGTILRNPFSNDGPLMAIVRVKPVYPASAEQRGLEGYVVVRFDVLPSGAVSNVTVVESSSALFERAAIAAAKGFRFRAQIVDGEARMSTGVQYQFRFEMPG